MIGKAPALEKGLKILELLLQGNEALTLSQIAEGVGNKVSEIQRMVEYLLQARYIVRTQSGAYLAGLRSFALAELNRESALISRAEGPMKRFSLRTKESIHLGFLTEGMLHVVFDSDGRGTIRVSVKPGVYEAQDSVSGRLLLAYAGEKGEDYEAMRRGGFAFGEASCARGLYLIAVPLAFGPNPCVAAIATAYLLQRDQAEAFFREELLEELRATATEIGGQF